MLKELNIIANGLLGLHGYPMHPIQWGAGVSNVNFPQPRPIVPHARPPLRSAGTSLPSAPAADPGLACYRGSAEELPS